MQWKRDLRTALALQGHKLNPVVRVSSMNKNIPLARTENMYHISCTRCMLDLMVETSPGVPTVVDPFTYVITCRKNRKKKGGS